MTTSRMTLSALNSTPPASNPAQVESVNDRVVLSFLDTVDQTAYWTFQAPFGLTAPLTLVINYFAAVASGTIAFKASLEAVTPTDPLALDVATSFDTANSSSADTVPATAGYLATMSITLTNNDSIAAGDTVRLSILRDTVTDSAAGKVYLYTADLRDAA